MSDEHGIISPEACASPSASGADLSMLPTAAQNVSAAPDLRAIQRAYLIGVGGVGMRGAAELLRARGIEVRGSDRLPPAEGAQGEVEVDCDDAALPADLDAVFFSAAIPSRHEQRTAARRAGVRQWRYAELVGALMEDRTGICVAGSHGKTTTASMVAEGLIHAGRDPSVLVGGTLLDTGRGWRHGAGPCFVAESCEFDRSFHAHRPRIAIVTNVDEDHLDYYRDLAEIQEAFRVFAALVPHDGVLIVNDAYAPLFRTDRRRNAGLQTYGYSAEAHWRAGEPRLLPAASMEDRPDGPTGACFDLFEGGVPRGEIQIPLPGRHNVLNATAAAAALSAAGCSFPEIRAALAAFGGVARRQEVIAEIGGVTVLDDYGHHPVEIRAVLSALRARYPGRRLVVVFQPHQASRTRCLLKEFAVALAQADEVWLPPIYFARDSEEERRSVTSEDLARHVGNEGGVARTLPDLAAVIDHGATHLRPGDVVVTMGAGNVDEVAHGLAARR